MFYGSCHPLMERLLDWYHTVCTMARKSIAMQLGYERFMAELAAEAAARFIELLKAVLAETLAAKQAQS